MITSYKDHDELRLDTEIAGWLARAITARTSTSGSWGTWGEALVCIPASPGAVRRRGFDHMRRIAGKTASLCGLPMIEALEHAGNAFDQRALGRAARAQNRSGTFSVRKGVEIPEKIVLVDDVLTTGATANAATEALLDAGAREVRVAVAARVW